MESLKNQITNEETKRQAECSYRKGYHQGYYQALCDVNKKYSLETPDLDAFFDGELYAWRLNTHFSCDKKDPSTFIIPPEYFFS